MPKPLNPSERETADLLARAGLRPAAATCLALLLRGHTYTRPDVATATGLAAPEVSAAMHELAREGAVTIGTAENEGPGRPRACYRLADHDTLTALIAARRKAVEEELQALDALEKKLAPLQ